MLANVTRMLANVTRMLANVTRMLANVTRMPQMAANGPDDVALTTSPSRLATSMATVYLMSLRCSTPTRASAPRRGRISTTLAPMSLRAQAG